MNKQVFIRIVVVAISLILSLQIVNVTQAQENLPDRNNEYQVFFSMISKPVPFSGRVVMVGYQNSNYDIYTMDADGNNRVRVTNTSSNVINLSPTWSPDGKKIAFARLNNATGREKGIYTINADGSGQKRLTNSDGLGEDLAPVWSPDGQKIAYFTSNNNQEQIIVINSSGGELKTLTADSYRSVLPDWSPNGQKIVYASTQNIEGNGRFEIFTMNPDGSGKKRLTVNSNSDDLAPRWSPDGKKIVFTSLRSGKNLIYVMNADGSNVKKVSDQPGFGPTWSPDGKMIMFTVQQGNNTNTELYVVNLDGSGLTRVTYTENFLEDSPDWR